MSLRERADENFGLSWCSSSMEWANSRASLVSCVDADDFHDAADGSDWMNDVHARRSIGAIN